MVVKLVKFILYMLFRPFFFFFFLLFRISELLTAIWQNRSVFFYLPVISLVNKKLSTKLEGLHLLLVFKLSWKESLPMKLLKYWCQQIKPLQHMLRGEV